MKLTKTKLLLIGAKIIFGGGISSTAMDVIDELGDEIDEAIDFIKEEIE